MVVTCCFLVSAAEGELFLDVVKPNLGFWGQKGGRLSCTIKTSCRREASFSRGCSWISHSVRFRSALVVLGSEGNRQLTKNGHQLTTRAMVSHATAKCSLHFLFVGARHPGCACRPRESATSSSVSWLAELPH